METYLQNKSKDQRLQFQEKNIKTLTKSNLFIYKKSLELASIAKQANVMDMKTRIKEVDEIMKEIKDRV